MDGASIGLVIGISVVIRPKNGGIAPGFPSVILLRFGLLLYGAAGDVGGELLSSGEIVDSVNDITGNSCNGVGDQRATAHGEGEIAA